MRASTRVLDRIFVGVVGLVFLTGGAWLLAYRMGFRPTVTATHRLSPRTIASAPDHLWWQTEVGVIGVALILISVWLLIRHLLRSSDKTAATVDGGTVDLTRVGEAVAADLARHPLVRRARSTVLTEKGIPVVRVSVSVPPDADAEELAAFARTAQREVAQATNPDVRLQILVNGNARPVE